jgi:hypothetical protein
MELDEIKRGAYYRLTRDGNFTEGSLIRVGMYTQSGGVWVKLISGKPASHLYPHVVEFHEEPKNLHPITPEEKLTLLLTGSLE